MKKLRGPIGNLLLLAGSTGLCFLIAEVASRVVPWDEYDERQLNNPYYYIERIGDPPPFSPYSSCAERVPLRFDHHSYYARTDGLVSFHANQFGARWLAPADQPLAPRRVLVGGDSFTYGHGLHYEDIFVFRLQDKFARTAAPVTFVNFAKRGAEVEEVLAIYRRFKDTVPHGAVLYGLHLNDLLLFTTSYATTNPLAVPWLVERSKAFDFFVKRIDRLLLRRYRISHLTDPARLKEERFATKVRIPLIVITESGDRDRGFRRW